MLINYLKIAIRNLLKHKQYSILNITGLAVSLACVIFILQWVQHELGYDAFNEKSERVYRVIADFHDDAAKWASTPGPMAPELEQELPQVVNATRFRSGVNTLFRYNNEAMFENGVAVADPSFFDIFSVEFLAGDARNALSAPGRIVFTESAAKKYFGDQYPLNRQLEVNDQLMTVSAVIKDWPENSHMGFRFLTSFEAAEKRNDLLTRWNRFPTYTYVLIDEQSDPQAVAGNITALYKKNNSNPNTNKSFELQPLQSIHLEPGLFNDDSTNVNRNYIYIFSVIAVFILLIACINYMSISTARFTNRAKEIGLKKVMGAARKDIVMQFMGESFLITFAAFILALGLAVIGCPIYAKLSSSVCALNLVDPRFLFSLVGILIVTALIAGAYPAFYLSAIKPQGAFKQKIQAGKTFGFRHILTIVQFSLSIALITGMLVVNEQVHFLQNKSLGFNKDNVLCVEVNRGVDVDYESMRDELLRQPGIAGVAVKNCSPEHIARATQSVNWQGNDPDEDVLWEVNWINESYLSDLNVALLFGRSFSLEHPGDVNNSVIINETGLSRMGITDPIGKTITVYGNDNPRTIVGVIKDANFHSLHKSVEPQVFLPMTEEPISAMGFTLLVRTGDRIDESVRSIKSVWDRRVTGYPLEYSFLDERYERMYQLEQRIKLLFNGFTVFAIFISCLGLFGFASFMAEKRTKEIGVRKVLGASLSSILRLLLGGFINRILISSVISWPIAWYAMHKWLENFAYRINITVWPFLLAGAAALLIAMLTVSLQVIKAATADPVKALRYE